MQIELSASNIKLTAMFYAEDDTIPQIKLLDEKKFMLALINVHQRYPSNEVPTSLANCLLLFAQLLKKECINGPILGF